MDMASSEVSSNTYTMLRGEGLGRRGSRGPDEGRGRRGSRDPGGGRQRESSLEKRAGKSNANM